MPPTGTAPITIERINTEFYVYGAGATFGTMQEAINYVTSPEGSGVGRIVICHGHGYTENIPSLTGGDSAIMLYDERDGASQVWLWNGTKFVPGDNRQLSGYVAQGMPAPLAGSIALGFDPTGGSVPFPGPARGDGKLIVSANAGQTVPTFQLQAQRSDGGANYTYLTCDLDANGSYRIVTPQALEVINDQDQLNMWLGSSRDANNSQGLLIWAQQALNVVDLQTETVNSTFRPTIRLNHLGGLVETGGQLLARAGVAATGAGPQNAGSIAMDFNPNAGVMGEGGGAISLIGNANTGIPFFSILIMPGDGSVPESAPVQIGEDLLNPGTLVTQLNSKVRFLPIDKTEGFWIGQQEAGQPTASTGKGMSITTDAGADEINFQGRSGTSNYNQKINLNALGGDVWVNGSPVRTFANSSDGGGMVWPLPGVGVSGGDHWEPSLDPATLAVWPPAGIPVSTGTAWGTSVPAGDVARLSQQNIFTQLNVFNGGLNATSVQVVGGGPFTTNISNSSQHARFISVYQDTTQPGAVELLGLDSSQATQVRYFQGVWSNGLAHDLLGAMATIQGNGNGSIPGDFGAGCSRIAWNVPAGTGNTVFVNYHGGGGGGFAWYNVADGAVVNAATPPAMTLDLNNSLTAHLVGAGEAANVPNARQVVIYCDPNGSGGNGLGTIQTVRQGVGYSDLAINPNGGNIIVGVPASVLIVNGSISTAGGITGNSLYWGSGCIARNFTTTSGDGVSYFDSLGVGTNRPVVAIRQGSHDGSNIINSLVLDGGGNATFAATLTTASDIHGQGAFYLSGAMQGLRVFGQTVVPGNFPNQWVVSVPYPSNAYVDIGGGDNATQGVMHFRTMNGNGSSYQEVLVINSSGIQVTGNISKTGSNSFVIPHPLIPNKLLVHACIEGPENGVYYRGEGETVDGKTIITLPDYFEVLTITDQRSVQLTAIVEQEPATFAQLAAGRVTAGQFTVYSSVPSMKFCWEVKAIRADIPPLAIVRDKPADPPIPTSKQEAQHDGRSSDRAGARKDGKLRAKA